MARSFKPASGQDILNKTYEETLKALVMVSVPFGTFTAGRNAAVGTSSGTLAASATCSAVIVQAGSANGTATLYVGDATTQPMELGPKQSITLPVSNVNVIYVKVSTGTGTANYIHLPAVTS